MQGLKRGIARFKAEQRARLDNAVQTAALQIACHVDLQEALQAGAKERGVLAIRLERAIERERQRGMRRHWSYDLNRHIALKQALDRLRSDNEPNVAEARGRHRASRGPAPSERISGSASTPGRKNS